jgi:hypothetical protein
MLQFSTNFSIIIITQGRYNRPFSGRRAEGTQLGLPPSPQIKKKNSKMLNITDILFLFFNSFKLVTSAPLRIDC